MNRYSRGPGFGGPSRATASTTCQKCLKRGHFSYECKATAQDRPYISRPSRTQQLLNPKLLPKLTSDIPEGLLKKKGVADAQLAKAELERGRKRERESEEVGQSALKRMRSSSSDSISTISTNLSRSPSPISHQQSSNQRPEDLSQSPPRRTARDSNHHKHKSRSISISAPRRRSDLERKRRRDSESSAGSYTLDDTHNGDRGVDEPTSNRSTRRKLNQRSPPTRGRRSESGSPRRVRRRLSNDRQQVADGHASNLVNSGRSRGGNPPKERSLSPFSKRLALTQAMNR